MDIVDGMSMDTEKTERDKLKAVFPECFSEDKLDIDKLLTMCGEYITNDFEKYKFEWKGKTESLILAQKRSTGTLRPKIDESVNFEETQNLYIKGDNLEVIKILQTSYFNKVKMIYIDVPYNTGHDFVYEDDFKDPIERYKEVTSQATRSNPETMGRFHTAWLNMMYPRLRLAATLLREDGVCFISIDDNEVHNLRKLCDETFGEENFVAEISWRRSDNQPNIGNLARVKEYILFYAKDKNKLKLGKLPLTEKAKNEYRYSDENGMFRRAILLDKTRGRHNYDVITKSGNILNGPWMVKEESFKELATSNGIYWTSGGEEQPYGKIYLHESKGQIPNDFWGIEFGTNQKASKELEQLFGFRVFDFTKPVSLISTLITLSCSANDIILDFFSGSATTAHAVMQLNAEDGGNRQFIMVQLPEVCDEKTEAYKAGYKNICDIGMERIRRAGAKILAEQKNQLEIGEEEKTPLDVGFKVFELDTSNLKAWDGTPIAETEQQVLFERMNAMFDNVKSDRSDMDMVYEVMLKMGIPLTYPILPLDINGKIAYSIGEECLLLVCLAEGVIPEDIIEMCEYAPAKLIIGRSCMKDDSTMSNAYYIMQDREISWKLI